MSAATEQHARRPLGLVISGETRRHADVLRKLLEPELVMMLDAGDMGELLGIVQHGQADAVVVDSDRDDQELLQILRLIRRVNMALPVILVAREISRRFLEGALRLEAFSIAHKPLEREDLLMQVRRIMDRYYPQGLDELHAPSSDELSGQVPGIPAAGGIVRPAVVRFARPEETARPVEQAPSQESEIPASPAPPTPSPRTWRIRRTFYFRFTRPRNDRQDRP